MAELYFNKANTLPFSPIFPKDRLRYCYGRGDLHFKSAFEQTDINVFIQELNKAKALYVEGTRILPHSIEAYTGLAKTALALEWNYPAVMGKNYQHDPLPVLEHLYGLMPTSIYTHKLLLRYYENRKDWNQVNTFAANLITLSPKIYGKLRKESYFSEGTERKVQQSLLKNLDKNIFTEDTFRTLSAIALRQGDISQSIKYFEKIIQSLPTRKLSSSYFIDLGGLYLKEPNAKKAEENFLTAIISDKTVRYLPKIWSHYRKSNYPHLFTKLCFILDQHFPGNDLLELTKAKSLIQANKLKEASSYLSKISSSGHLPESLFLQGQIAQKLKNWDEMEIKAQKATVLEPSNAKYFMLFSKALKQQKKYQQAEKAANKAIDLTSNANPWYLNHRAWIRWAQRNYLEALQDWDAALQIKPNHADYYFFKALCYEKTNDLKSAMKELRVALTLKPEDERYLRKATSLSRGSTIE